MLKSSGEYQTAFDYITKWKTSQIFSLEYPVDEGRILLDIHKLDCNNFLDVVLTDATTLSKKKNQKIIEVVTGRIAEVLLREGTKFEPGGSEILWPGGYKSFKTSDINEFIGQKKGRPKKQKNTVEKIVEAWKCPSSTPGIGKCKTKIIFQCKYITIYSFNRSLKIFVYNM